LTRGHGYLKKEEKERERKKEKEKKSLSTNVHKFISLQKRGRYSLKVNMLSFDSNL
jgi:hypothetical protein